MKIGSRVYVSFLSGSKIAGETGTVIGVSTRDGYKVRTDFGVVGYPKPEHVSAIDTDAPEVKVQPRRPFIYDTDVQHMYLTSVLPLVIDPTDLLCRAVRIETPFIRTCGWVTDQWIEDGVELLNVVHAGEYSVVPRSTVTHVLKFVE